VDFTITPKTVSAPTITLSPESYTYDGSAKQPTVTVKDGTTVISADEYTVSYSNNTNAGTATVTVTDKTGGNYAVSGEKTFTISPKEVNNPTIELSQDTYTYDGTAKQPTVTVKDGTTVIPASEYNVEYSSNTNAGTATVTITDKTGGNYTVSGTKTFTIGEAVPTVTAPTANTLTYNGSAQALVTGGSATGGTMQYSTSQNGTYSTTIPTGTDAGSYTVWYKVVGDTGYSDTTPASIAVTIAKAASSVTTAPAANELTYNGKDQELVTAGTVTGGTIQYSLDGTAYSAAVPTGKNVGSYTVYYKVAGDNNHNDTAAQTVSVSIAKAESSAETPTAKTDLVYTGSAQELVTAGTATGGELQYSLDGTDYSAAVPTATDAGDYTVYYKVAGDANHGDIAAEQINVSIAKADSSVTSAPTAKTGLTVTGSALALVNAGTAEGGEMQYSLDGVTYSADIPTATAAGTYTVYYKVIGDKNHTDTEAKTVTATIAQRVTPAPYIPSYAPTGTTTTTTTTTNTTPDITKYTITGKQDELNESALTWDAIPNASAYALYVKVDGKYVFVQDLGKSTVAEVVVSTSGKYYVSTGKDYTIYKYDSKTGKFTKTGTLKASSIEKIVKANNVTEDFMVKYTVNGKESTENNSYKVSVKIYYKPAVRITANKGSITLKWNKVPEATKYRVYKYVNGSLKLITETTKRAVRITGTKSGKEYSYAVKAYVDGKWTKVYTSDIATVTGK